MDTKEIIKSISFENCLENDLSISEIQSIKEMNTEHLGHLDAIDMMYYAYKLGFAKGLKASGKSPEQFKDVVV